MLLLYSGAKAIQCLQIYFLYISSQQNRSFLGHKKFTVYSIVFFVQSAIPMSFVNYCNILICSHVALPLYFIEQHDEFKKLFGVVQSA